MPVLGDLTVVYARFLLRMGHFLPVFLLRMGHFLPVLGLFPVGSSPCSGV